MNLRRSCIRTGVRPDPASSRRGQCYVFHYPYVTTPCFLIDLGASGHSRWARSRPRTDRSTSGPVVSAPGRSVVAFAANLRAQDDASGARGQLHHLSPRRSGLRRFGPPAGTRAGGHLLLLRAQCLRSGPGRPGPRWACPSAARGDRARPLPGGRHPCTPSAPSGGRCTTSSSKSSASGWSSSSRPSDLRRRVTGQSEVVAIEEYSRTRVHCG